MKIAISNTNSSQNNVGEVIRQAEIIFWDFDGVIKDSVSVKSEAFEQLFKPYGLDIAKRIRYHHEANGGVSRYEKIPTYLEWIGKPASETQAFCDKFSNLVLQAVIDSPWVPGVREYLKAYHLHQYFVLITATPQEEIEQILMLLGISDFFQEIYGAPYPKKDAINETLCTKRVSPELAIVIGDSETDYMAAKANNVPFLLRRSALNNKLQHQLSANSFEYLKV